MEHLSSQHSALNVLRALWLRHVRETEAHVLHILTSTSHVPDGLVGFFMVEHTDLTARLNAVAADAPSTDRTRALVQLIHRLMLHVSMEARALPPMAVQGPAPDLDSAPGTA